MTQSCLKEYDAAETPDPDAQTQILPRDTDGANLSSTCSLWQMCAYQNSTHLPTVKHTYYQETSNSLRVQTLGKGGCCAQPTEEQCRLPLGGEILIGTTVPVIK